MCCSGPSWKREVVPDHKFDFIDTREFHSKSFGIRIRYLWLYVLVVKSFLVYVSDIFTAVTMLSTTNWANSIFKSCPKDNCFIIPFRIGRWLFVGCIIFSFLLLAYEARKAKKIVVSRDISYAFTNVMANNYYSLRSYDHFCFFCQISNSTKKKDDFAFFVFFTFKSWKRVLFADGPRQVINALTLYSFYLSKNTPGSKPFYTLSKYTDGNFVTTGLIISTLFTVLVFAGSLLLLFAAAVCYVPLLCYIQGNLKEYCCHKVDKRIADLMKRKNKRRLLKAADLARKEAAGDFSHLKNKKGELIARPLPQPTLPKIGLDYMDETDNMSMRTRVEADQGNHYWKGDYKEYQHSLSNIVPDYPPMPAYQPQYNYEAYSSSIQERQGYDYDDNFSVSQLTLTQGAAPISGHAEAVSGGTSLPNPYSAIRPTFALRDLPGEERQLREPGRRSSGLAYNTDYPSSAEHLPSRYR